MSAMADQTMQSPDGSHSERPRRDSTQPFQTIDLDVHSFRVPKKEIFTQADLPHFLQSRAHRLIVSFVNHLSNSLIPPSSSTKDTQSFFTDSSTIEVSPAVQGVIDLVEALDELLDQAPPEEGPRRFGNVAFRKWYALAQHNAPSLLRKHLSKDITTIQARGEGSSALAELEVYLLGGFGSAQRLDYGTGHELSFLAFLCGIWTLGGFEYGKDELGLILKGFDRYLALVRKIILLYNLEPAGTHGVSGLDDHSFLPYIFGSAQLLNTPESTGPPPPGCVVEENTVQRERNHNMYIGAVAFIRDVKKGPFWEHSPYLFDISGVVGGWKKINQGMLKMFSAEVLGKFPVVQHFPFGSIFSWELVDETSSIAAQEHKIEEKHSWSAAPVDRDSSLVETQRARTSTPSSYNPKTLEGIHFHKPDSLLASVPGGTAPTISGIPVTTAPWAKAPTGPGGAGPASRVSSILSPSPASLARGAPPQSNTRAMSSEIATTNVPEGNVSVGDTGSLAGGRVTQDAQPQDTGVETATRAPWAK